MIEQQYKFVDFDEWCKTCAHLLRDETEYPCYNCLANATNLYSHKPTHWKEDERRTKND